MNLLIDIGNTKCSLAVTEGRRIRKRYFIHTDKKEVQPASLKRLLGAYRNKIDDIVIVSVVPKFLTIVKKSLKAVVPDAGIRIVGKDIIVPMKIKYKIPEEVGQDRLVTAYAAREENTTPLLVIDFGTAVTFDLVNRKGEYEGGLIFPGLRLSLESLENNTALLPYIDVHPIRGLIGKDTKGSMNKGIVLGYASLCEGIIKRFRKEFGKSLRVLATGGDSALIARYAEGIEEVAPDLVFKGLSRLAS